MKRALAFTLLYMFVMRLSIAGISGNVFAQPLINVPNIQPLLVEDGSFLSAPIDLGERRLIGRTISEAIDEFGHPHQIFSIRGEEEWQDDVVFFYNNYLYLYWYDNRVWQIRYDQRYAEAVAGLRMGQAMAEVLRTLGQPHYIGEDNIFYDLREEGYPIRLRLVFEAGQLHDLYLYRSDF